MSKSTTIRSIGHLLYLFQMMRAHRDRFAVYSSLDQKEQDYWSARAVQYLDMPENEQLKLYPVLFPS